MEVKVALVLALFMVGAARFADAASAPSIRGVFIGIDQYRYSQPGGFRNLRGAVGDAGRIKSALRAAFQLNLDHPKSGSCRSENTISITLTDDCADRAAILGALDQQIAASAEGDTLIFYFAGHGSQYSDDRFDQANGRNDTIMPTDARQPGAASGADILDREIFEIINRATVAGINVVTIFDSCNSGTATRDLTLVSDAVSRNVAPLRGPPPARAATASRVAPPRAVARQPGYRVHLAAAADGELAMEVGAVGERAGAFTTALAATLVEIPHATFADIALETRLKVEALGHVRQHPQASGELTATLGGRSHPGARLLDATPAGEAVELQGGLLSGVTEGSTYALFANTSEAILVNARPLATGQVTSVAADRSTLRLDGAPALALPQRLVARETSHGFGQRYVLVRNKASTAQGRALVQRAINGSAVARIAEPAQLVIASRSPADVTLGIYTEDGRLLADLGDPRPEEFAFNLGRQLEKVARVQALLALRTDPGNAPALFCLATGSYDPEISACPAGHPSAATTLKGPSSEPRLKAGQRAQATIRNMSDTPHHIYVLGIDEDYSVQLLFPKRGDDDVALAERPLMRDDFVAGEAGERYRFVTITTDAPINARALEQSSIGTRGLGGCRTALERALCAAMDGTRDVSTPRVGAWTASVSSVVVEK